MNIASKKVSALVFSVIVMSSMNGMDHENMIEVTTGQPVPSVWYKNSSVQVAAVVATVTAALVSYVVAVRMGKVPAPALPAFAAGLFAATAIHGSKVETSTPEFNFVNDNSQQIQHVSVEQNQEQVQQISEVLVQRLSDAKKAAVDFRNSANLFTWDDYKRTLEGITEEDFKQMNEHLVR